MAWPLSVKHNTRRQQSKQNQNMQTHTSLIDNEMAETWILAVFINNRLLFFKYALYFKDCVIFFHKRNCYIPQNHAIFNMSRHDAPFITILPHIGRVRQMYTPPLQTNRQAEDAKMMVAAANAGCLFIMPGKR